MIAAVTNMLRILTPMMPPRRHIMGRSEVRYSIDTCAAYSVRSRSSPNSHIPELRPPDGDEHGQTRTRARSDRGTAVIGWSDQCCQMRHLASSAMCSFPIDCNL